MNSLKIARKHAEKEHYVFFIGSFDENAEFLDLKDTESPKLIMDFKKVSYLNSIGIAKWVKWINELATALPRVSFVFRNCPQIFVNQMNTIKNFRPPAVKVETFEVPFYCEDCNFSSIANYELSKDFVNSPDVGLQFYHPEIECSKCGADMELDVMENKYFSFLKEE